MPLWDVILTIPKQNLLFPELIIIKCMKLWRLIVVMTKMNFRLWFKMPRAQRRLLNLQIEGLRRVLSQPPSLPCLVASVAARRREFSAACEAGEYAAWANFPRFARFTPFLPHFPPPSPPLLQAASPQDAHQSQAFAAALVRAQQVGGHSHHHPRGGDSTGIVCTSLCYICWVLRNNLKRFYIPVLGFNYKQSKTLCPTFSLRRHVGHFYFLLSWIHLLTGL